MLPRLDEAVTEIAEHIRPLVEGREVSKIFASRPGLYGSLRRRFVRAVDRVSIEIYPGEIVGLVGESGSGKSALGKLLIRLETPTSGAIIFDGQDITRLRGPKLRQKRRGMQIIFQDPASSLNPRYTVRDTLLEAIQVHRKKLPSRRQNAHLAALVSMAGLPISALERYPRELSGGERQRVAIARALAVEPRFIVADEPVSSLDFSNQANIINLLDDLRSELNVAFLLIAHDLDIVRHLCRRVAVMYLGRIVETAPAEILFQKPRHPYTQALTAASLQIDPDKKRSRLVLPGEPPSPLDPPTGCHFHPRCNHADARCRLIEPLLREAAPGHLSKCHFDL